MNDAATCTLCPRLCKIPPEAVGFCKGRKNIQGEIIPINYGQILSLALDPIEKKPFMDFHKNAMILSIGSFGCNMDCPFCQNYTIARASKDDYQTQYLSPSDLTSLAQKYKEQGNIGVAFTYNEPLVGYEYVLDSSMELTSQDLVVAVITNGNFNPDYIKELLPYTDAFNVDLKAFDAETYRSLGGDLDTVFLNIEQIYKKCHLEITTLVVPGISDDVDLFGKAVQKISTIGKDIPLHISRYYPSYKYQRPPTPKTTMYEFMKVAKKYLGKVQLGNMF